MLIRKSQIVLLSKKNFTKFFEIDASLTGGLTESEVVNEHFHSAYVMESKGRVVGRFALYVNEALLLEGEPAICIGSYACVNSEVVANELLTLAEDCCRDLGYKLIIGPMNGSTWHTHRFSIESEAKQFSVDIGNPEYYNQQFTSVGFEVIGNYVTNFCEDDAIVNSSLTDAYWENRGLTIRNLDRDNLDEELARIAVFSNLAFKNNFLFTPIVIENFILKYRHLITVIETSLVYVGEDSNKEIQCVSFTFPDPDVSSGKKMIGKTVAIRPDSKYKGLGVYISRKSHTAAINRGYDSVIHAFMHIRNASMKLSNKYVCKSKSYRLYAKHIS